MSRISKAGRDGQEITVEPHVGEDQRGDEQHARCELPAETALRSCLLKCEPEQRLKEQQTTRQRGNQCRRGWRSAGSRHPSVSRQE